MIYDLLLTFVRGHHSSIEPSGEKIRHGDGEVKQSAGVPRSIPPRFMLVAYMKFLLATSCRNITTPYTGTSNLDGKNSCN